MQVGARVGAGTGAGVVESWRAPPTATGEASPSSATSTAAGAVEDGQYGTWAPTSKTTPSVKKPKYAGDLDLLRFHCCRSFRRSSGESFDSVAMRRRGTEVALPLS